MIPLQNPWKLREHRLQQHLAIAVDLRAPLCQQPLLGSFASTDLVIEALRGDELVGSMRWFVIVASHYRGEVHRVNGITCLRRRPLNFTKA